MRSKSSRFDFGRLCVLSLAAALLVSVSNLNTTKFRGSEERWPCEGESAPFIDRSSWNWRRTLRRCLRGEERLVLHIRVGSVADLAIAWGVTALVLVFKITLLSVNPTLKSGEPTRAL